MIPTSAALWVRAGLGLVQRRALTPIVGDLASPAGERVRSCAIITTTPNELCAELNNRMPVILAPDTWPAWLGEEPADEPRLKSCWAPALPPH